jgi:hypothetical protein
MTLNDEQGHRAHLEQLASMTRRELLAHCKSIVAQTRAGDSIGLNEPRRDFPRR